MNISRRDFIQSATLAGLSLPFLQLTSCQSGPSADSNFIDRIGAATYSVRDLLDQNPQSTLESLAQIGFTQVELQEPTKVAELIPILESVNLKARSLHFHAGYITNNWEGKSEYGPKARNWGYLVETAASAGIEYIVMPNVDEADRGGLDQYKIYASRLNELGNMAADYNVKVGYHNHAFEFEPIDRKTPFDILVEELDDSLVTFELDLFWVSVAGKNPAKLIRKLGNRVSQLHLKDKAENTLKSFTGAPENAFLPVGSGTLNFKAILAAAEEAGVSYAYVEQDHHVIGEPLGNMQSSLNYIKNIYAESQAE